MDYSELLETLTRLILPLQEQVQRLEERIVGQDVKIDKQTEIIQQNFSEQKADIQQEQKRLGEQIRKDIQHDMVILLDTEFKRNYDLLGERLDEILVKMPSEDDIDIIDGKLSEHDSELKVLRHDVNELKKAL